MAERVPKICIFGAGEVRLFSSRTSPSFEARALDCRCYPNDDDLERILATDDPDVIITVGEPASYPKLHRSPAEIGRRWLNFTDADDLDRIGAAAFHCFIDNCVRERTDLPPLVSVFTPAYRTGERIQRPYASLQRQTYRNWEWIIVDDSDDDDRTFRHLSSLARADHRLGVFKHHVHRGVIGQVKRWACRLANGQILVELDHDDELTPGALADVVCAFAFFDGNAADRPRAGFVYTDFAELAPDGAPVTYGPGWAFGYGSYRRETREGRTLEVANAPNINPKTIRHIVGVPNHLRAWHRDAYHECGGHGRHVHVADDYELLVRTFLTTRMVRVPRLGYLQWRNAPQASQAGNAHKERNGEIQRLTRAFSRMYDDAIHRRFAELGVDDFVWKNGEDTFSRLREIPNPPIEPHCTLRFESGEKQGS